MKWLLKYLFMSGAVVLFFLIAMPLYHEAGRHAAEESLLRMETVWTDVMSMPELDRALLAGLAMTCRLENRPIERNETLKCLREAAVDPHATIPIGIEKKDALARLDELIAKAPPKK